jgi:hypothetical protein
MKAPARQEEHNSAIFSGEYADKQIGATSSEKGS